MTPTNLTEKSPSGWSFRMAQSMMRRDPQLADHWCYENGVALKGIYHAWLQSKDAAYWRYMQDNMDTFVQPDGSIRTYRLEEYNIDQINQGKLLFPLYRETGQERYRKAAQTLRQQLQTHPRTSEGGFWHKQIYPHQMWLDGIYMGSPFLTEYAARFDEAGAFDDVAHQVTLIEKHTRDEDNGLLYHGWDESRQQRWSNPETGRSPHFWGRAMGWYMMAQVDILELFPIAHPLRREIEAVLQRLATAVLSVQDPASGLWFQVLDQGGREGNYLEASASCMFAYGLAKGARLGWLDEACLVAARRAWAGILEGFVREDADGLLSLGNICGGAGLGGVPYRDGSYEYYVNEKIVPNDPKGVGAFIMAGIEVEQAGG
jgi:unsaturated rhamnogalacturonyl hydrolase